MPRKKPKIEIKLLTDTAKKLTQGPGDPAGLDIYSDQSLRVPGKGTKTIKTGVALAIESGYYGQIKERSGFSVNTSLGIKAGVIDSDYRGEIKVVMQNIHDFPYDIQKGEKIAQIVFHRHERPSVTYVDDFTDAETERGEKGFGSSD